MIFTQRIYKKICNFNPLSPYNKYTLQNLNGRQNANNVHKQLMIYEMKNALFPLIFSHPWSLLMYGHKLSWFHRSP